MKIKLLLLIAFLGFLACKKEDKCENVSCLNGGTCTNGECDCPPEWTGFNCKEVATPTNIYIKSITLTEFTEDKPDLFMGFFDNQFNQVIRISETVTDAIPGLTTFVFNPPIKFENDNYMIFKETSNEPQIIDGISFYLNPLFESGSQVKTVYPFVGTFKLVSGTATVDYEW